MGGDPIEMDRPRLRRPETHPRPVKRAAQPGSIPWPGGKRFAFTVFDDTDRATLENNRAIYGFLEEAGFRTTKSVWTLAGSRAPYIPGATCADSEYLAWVQALQGRGFEIAWHLATWETSHRDQTIRGLDRFRECFGDDPTAMANHASNGEGIYWGAARFSGWRRFASRLVELRRRFWGHVDGDPRFWGDLCRDRIRYVRNFTFEDIDTLAQCPEMPYYDPEKPLVRAWFAASSGADVDEFNRLIHPDNLDRLEASGGACIAYTHFGKGFFRDGQVDETFRRRMSGLARRPGWFVPVTPLLDFLADRHGGITRLTGRARARLEYRWLAQKLLSRFPRFTRP